MIYFLVNNDYQLLDARRHATQLEQQGLACSLIEVPHALTERDRSRGFVSATSLESPWKKHGWPSAWPHYVMAAAAVRRTLRPQPGDTLVLYTEYELLNHLVAMHFKRCGGRVLLLEDGGIGTYLPFSISTHEPLSFKEKIVAALTRTIPGLHRTRFHKVNGVVFPWLADDCIDAVCLYRPLRIVRALPVRVVAGPCGQPVDRVAGRVVFLNERIYDHYQPPSDYLHGLDLILESLEQGFAEVLFKFHPREDDDWIKRIRALLASRHPGVRVIEERAAFETILSDLQPEVVASYFSTPLMNLDGTGVEPMFLYHLLPDLKCQKVFAQLTSLLSQWNYRFVASWAEVRSGYISGMSRQTEAPQLHLSEVLAPAR